VVPHPAHREEELRILGIALDLLAQVPDVDVDGARVARIIVRLNTRPGLRARIERISNST
jgi:hypothetical protein